MKSALSIYTAACLLSVSYANAQFIIYEGFETPGDYADGVTITSQTGGGSGDWGGSNWSIENPGIGYQSVTTSLTYSDGSNNLITSDGSLSKVAGSNTISYRNFDNTAFNNTFGSGGEIWFSALFHAESTTDIVYRISRDSAFNGPGFNVENGQLTARFNNTISSSSISVDNGETYFVVGRVTPDTTNTLDLWLNPSLGSAPIGAGDLTVDQGYDLTLLARTIVQSRNNDSAMLDELRLGSTFASVTPNTAIPEPSTYVLLFACAIGAVAIRRRGKNHLS